MQRLEPNLPLRRLVIAAWTLAALLASPAGAARVVVLDPGHGGYPEAAGPFSGDHWDPAQRAFLNPYNYGAAHEPSGLAEHRIALSIAKRARAILREACTPEGFPAFRRILGRYGRPARGRDFPRPDLAVILTREDAAEDPPYADLADVNRFFRLYDSPTGFRDDGAPYPDLYPGRMSLINRAKPELVVSIHINSAKNPAVRGQASVVTPNGRLFEWLRDLKRDHGRDAQSIIARLDWFFHRAPILSNLSGLAEDATTYFDEGAKIHRHAKVRWRYGKSERDFRDRERSFAERMRRGGGESVGGDNLEASEEMIRFIRLALLSRLVGRETKDRDGEPPPSADRLVGPHGLPFARDYAVPLFINAISCYVEIGYMTNAEDRRLLTSQEEAYAEAIAVGVYSLLYGMRVEPPPALANLAGFTPPAGLPLDLKPYRKGRDYFQEVFPRECAIPERVLAFRERIETIPSAKRRPDGAPLPPPADPAHPGAKRGKAAPGAKGENPVKEKGKAGPTGKSKGKSAPEGKPRPAPARPK